MMLAEDLLLLLTDGETGKLAASGTEVDVALGGALLGELALTGRVEVAGSDERVREGRLVVRDPGPTGSSLLDEALATVAQQEGKKPQSVVGRLGKRTRGRLHERLADGGVVRAAEGRVLGIFPSHRWPAEDTAHEASVRAGLVEALRTGTTADPRTGALVSLLLALCGAQGRGAEFRRSLHEGDAREGQADRRGGLGGGGCPLGHRQQERHPHRSHHLLATRDSLSVRAARRRPLRRGRHAPPRPATHRGAATRGSPETPGAGPVR